MGLFDFTKQDKPTSREYQLGVQYGRLRRRDPKMADMWLAQMQQQQAQDFMKPLIGEKAQPANYTNKTVEMEGPLQPIGVRYGAGGVEFPEFPERPTMDVRQLNEVGDNYSREATEGSGYLGGKIDRRELAARMMGAPNQSLRNKGVDAVLSAKMDKPVFDEYWSWSPEQRKAYDRYSGHGFNTLPADIQTHQYYESLSPEQKSSFDFINRAPTVLNLPQSQIVRNPRGPDEVYKKDHVGAEADKKFGVSIEKKITDYPRLIEAVDGYVYETDQTLDFLDELADQTTGMSTGWASLLTWLPTSKAEEWQSLRDTILSRLSLDKLMEMKNNSATGASGFGQLSEKELKVLMDFRGSLKQSRTAKHLMHTIKRMVKHLQGVRSRFRSKKAKADQWYKVNSEKYAPEGYDAGFENKGPLDTAIPPKPPVAPPPGYEAYYDGTSWKARPIR